jgi:hypothetical protein
MNIFIENYSKFLKIKFMLLFLFLLNLILKNVIYYFETILIFAKLIKFIKKNHKL